MQESAVSIDQFGRKRHGGLAIGVTSLHNQAAMLLANAVGNRYPGGANGQAGRFADKCSSLLQHPAP
jgi:hypothetical protein